LVVEIFYLILLHFGWVPRKFDEFSLAFLEYLAFQSNLR
jgi:hypothetical protein